MSFPPQQQDFDSPDLQGFAKIVVNNLTSVEVFERLGKSLEPALLKTVETAVALVIGAAGPIAASFAKGIIAGENRNSAVFDELARVALQDITGIDANINARAGDRGSRAAAARNVGAGILKALSGITGAVAPQGGELQPSTAPAEDYLSFVVQMSMEGWLTDLMGSMLTLGAIENLGDLDDALAQALGLARSSRAVMRPFLRATVQTPAEWALNKAYRPELLGTADAVRQFHRGNWTREQLDEELARQGYNADRIEAFINAQRKFFSTGDVRAFVDRKHWTMDAGIQHLRDQGYDESAAVDAIRLEGLKRIEQLEASEATAIIAAYVDRRIAGGEFRSMLRAAVKNDEERALLEELADVRLAVNVKHLSPGEARAAAKALIVPISEYRRALERDGYTDDAVFALELLVRHEMNEQRELEELRAEQAAERAAEKLARESAAAERRAQVEADRARRRRGPIADLERAVTRGLISLGRLQEVLAAEYDADTVAILSALVESDRLRYLEQQARADEARQRAERRELGVGEFERAVMAGLLTPEEFAARLAFLKFDPADAALLTAVVRAKKADQDAAIAARRTAEELARRRRIDLGRFERLVRRGARSLADYNALLEGLGFEDADRAGMRELLELQIADDRAADAERAAARDRIVPRGLTLEQLRRAVVLGTSTEDDYQRFLIEQHYTADAQAVLLADLRLAVDEAEDARRRREQPAPAQGARGLALSTLQRAARLGIITPDTYADRLRALGYSDDDLAIEMELLVTEIADIQEARQQRAAVEPDADTRGLTLAQVERAVRAGALTLEDYRSRAVVAGLSSEAVEIIVAVLAQEVGTLTEAREIRAIVLRQLADGNVSLEELEAGVLKRWQSVEEFTGALEQLGVGGAESELVAALLLEQLEADAAKKTGGGNG